MSTVQGGHFFTPEERTPIQLRVLMLQLLPQPRVEGGRWKVFLCLTLFVYSTQHFGSNKICIVIIGLNLTNSSLLPFNKAQDLDTKLQKPFTPLSPHTESPLATQTPRSSRSFHFYLAGYSKPFTNSLLGEAFSAVPRMPMFFSSPYAALNLFNLLYKAEGLLRAKAPVCHMKR